MTSLKTDTKRLGPADIAQAGALLRGGALVAFPTETVYGLGADARNGDAVARIYEAKGRPSFNPLIVHVPDLETAQELADVPEQLLALGQAFWPGPLSLVVPVKAASGLSSLVTAGLETVALRVPAHPLARALLREAGVPVAAPSANASGLLSPTRAAHVLSSLEGRIDAVLDGGACSVGLESSIVGMGKTGPVLLRAGGLSRELLEEHLDLKFGAPERGKIQSPGQLLAHYAPRAPLRLEAETPKAQEAYLGFGARSAKAQGLNLSEAEDLREAAANLFSHLHSLDEMVRARGLAGIAAAPVPTGGLGAAINDRLRRAAER